MLCSGWLEMGRFLITKPGTLWWELQGMGRCPLCRILGGGGEVWELPRRPPRRPRRRPRRPRLVRHGEESPQQENLPNQKDPTLAIAFLPAPSDFISDEKQTSQVEPCTPSKDPAWGQVRSAHCKNLQISRAVQKKPEQYPTLKPSFTHTQPERDSPL